MQRNDEDSCGVFRVRVREPLAKSSPVSFTARGSASGSQRWFGVYEVEPAAAAKASGK
jgi:hypothetical protein